MAAISGTQVGIVTQQHGLAEIGDHRTEGVEEAIDQLGRST